MDLIILILCFACVITAFFSVESKDEMSSILLLLAFTVLIGLGFIYVGAIYAGIFQLLVYSGVMTVIFAVTTYTVSTRDKEILEVTA